MSDDLPCSEVLGPIWKLGGESCACILPAVHVFDDSVDEHGCDHRAHKCDCGTWWYDGQQVTEARGERR